MMKFAQLRALSSSPRCLGKSRRAVSLSQSLTAKNRLQSSYPEKHATIARAGLFETAWGVNADVCDTHPCPDLDLRISYGLVLLSPRIFLYILAVTVQTLAPQLFAFSLFPYLGFLYHLTRSKSAPKLTLIGFYFLLVFVGATIPAGIYAKTHYGTSLANVDWLHGSAESLLTVTNLLVVLGLRRGIRDAEEANATLAPKTNDISSISAESVAPSPPNDIE